MGRWCSRAKQVSVRDLTRTTRRLNNTGLHNSGGRPNLNLRAGLATASTRNVYGHPIDYTPTASIGRGLLVAFNPVESVIQVFVRAQVCRARMALELFGARGPAAESSKLATCLAVLDLLERHCAQELANPESASISRRFPGWQNVIRSSNLGMINANPPQE